MCENEQNYLSNINEILQVLQSVVNESFLSRSESKCPEDQLAAEFFPVINCFASVIHFVKRGSVNIPQVLVKQFLDVAKILNIVREEDVKEEDLNYIEEDDGDDHNEEEMDEEDVISDNYWWDDGTQAQYRLYWDVELEDEEDQEDEVFDTGPPAEEEVYEQEDGEDSSIAHRVKVRRSRRLGAVVATDWVPPTPATCTTPTTPSTTSPPSTPSPTSPGTRMKSSIYNGNDLFITSLLRTIHRTAPKAVYNTRRAEILRKERCEERISDLIPDEFRSLWDTHEDEEEVVKIIVPDPYPKIDWSQVNKRFISNIPEPTRFPIHSCSPDPAFYEWSERKFNGATEKVPPQFEKYDYYRKKGWFKAAEGMHVFGGIWGYQTSEGIVSVASLVHHGYIWQNGWILHAQKPKLEENVSKKRKSEDGKFQSQKKFGGRKRATQNLSSTSD